MFAGLMLSSVMEDTGMHCSEKGFSSRLQVLLPGGLMPPHSRRAAASLAPAPVAQDS